MNAKSKSCFLIPEEERKCIWMTTGLISYRLCDRNYLCESCPFDQAIKNEESGENNFIQSAENWVDGSSDSDPSTRINGHIFYHRDHCWVNVENPEKVKIGIDNLLSQILAEVQVVILPQIGSFMGQGECYAHIIQDDYILPLISPLSGLIKTVNPRLKKEPTLITEDPGGEGWLIAMKPKNLESDLKSLIFGRKALSWYQREEKDLIAQTDLLLKHNPLAVGPTMQDGGVRISCLRDMLNMVTAKQRARLLDFSMSRTEYAKRLLAKPPA